MGTQVLPISMGSSTLSDMKADLTAALQKCLTEMEKAESDTGKVTLSVSITKDKVPVTTEKDYREAIVPKIKWKAESNVPMKSSYDGEFGGDYELTKENGAYCMKPISGQTSMFDVEEEEDEEEDEDE